MPPRGYLAIFGSSPVVARPIGSHAPWLSTWLSMTFWLLFAIGTSALPTNKTVSPRAETPSRQFAQVFAQICSRAAEHATLAGNIFRWHRMAAVIADTNRESY